ncbi:hypothetical protein AgCh_010711 [Apium graveolens]
MKSEVSAQDLTFVILVLAVLVMFDLQPINMLCLSPACVNPMSTTWTYASCVAGVEEIRVVEPESSANLGSGTMLSVRERLFPGSYIIVRLLAGTGTSKQLMHCRKFQGMDMIYY